MLYVILDSYRSFLYLRLIAKVFRIQAWPITLDTKYNRIFTTEAKLRQSRRTKESYVCAQLGTNGMRSVLFYTVIVQVQS